MSYSFTVVAPSKAEAKARVTQELAKTMAAQPPHIQDCMAVATAAHAFIDALKDGDGNITATIYGSVTPTSWENPAAPLTSAQVNINCVRS